jgi:hypothetical protein
LLGSFANGSMKYEEFSARTRRRFEGKDEDSDWKVPEDYTEV